VQAKYPNNLEDEIAAEGKKSVEREDPTSKPSGVQTYGVGGDNDLEKRNECKLHGVVN